MSYIRVFFVTLLALTSAAAIADKNVKNETLKPDNASFLHVKEEFKGQGIVKKIISSETSKGVYYFVFVEKPIRKEVFPGNVVTDYGVKPDGEWGEIKTKKEDDVTYTIKNLRAYILHSYHGGYEQLQKFQDDGNVVYWPEFLDDDCFVDDADGDGNPEFYLTYFGLSDGLDAKPLKVIVYDSNQKVGNGFLKGKITAFYPAGNEDDSYRVEYNETWLSLPEKIRKRAERILVSHREEAPERLHEDKTK